MNAPITYFGGKNGMAKHIINYFPNKETYNTYIEPFGGSYGVGLHMNYIPPVEIYNDLDNNVYSLYKVLQDKELFTEFQRLCELSPYSDEMNREFILSLRNDDLSTLERAYRFYYVNRTSFNGNGGFKMNCVIRRKTSKSVSDYLSSVERLEELHNRLTNIIVYNRDGIELIKKFNNKENVLIYCDPPYVQSTRSSNRRYDVDMEDDIQDKFLDVCLNCRCKMLISGYDNEKYDILLENGYNKVEFEVNHRIETLWRNY
jgi:DNA adenine methylase